MTALTHSDYHTFARHALIRACLKSISERVDDLEKLAGQCGSGDLQDALRNASSGILGAISDACIDKAIEDEVRETDFDREDARVEMRNNRVLASASASGR